MGIPHWLRRTPDREARHGGAGADRAVRQARPLLESLEPRLLFDAVGVGTESSLPNTPPEEQAIIVETDAGDAELQEGNSPVLTVSAALLEKLDSAQVQTLDASGADGLGAQDVSADLVDIAAIMPVYRFWSPVYEQHFYTIEAAERDKLINQYRHVWTYEGVAYQAFADGSRPDVAPVYRFWSGSLRSHFYTIDETEKNGLLRNYSNVWTYEGPAFYAYPARVPALGTSPIYRFWSGSLGGHFYTMSEAEMSRILNDYSSVWTYEDVAWYAFPPTSPIPGTPLPDLAWDSLNGTPTVVSPGGTLMLSPRYYNVYMAPVVPDFTIQYRLSLDTTWGDADDVILMPDEIINTTEGKTIGLRMEFGTFMVTVPTTTPSGMYFLLGRLDNGDTVTELNENNNVMATTTRLLVSGF